MARSIHVRLDDAAEQALRTVRNGELTDSEAVRLALEESAQRRMSRMALRAEVERLNADAADRAEKQAILALMEELAPGDDL
jgi:hypothetical protein